MHHQDSSPIQNIERTAGSHAMLYMKVAKSCVIFWKGDSGILERLSVSGAQLEQAIITKSG